MALLFALVAGCGGQKARSGPAAPTWFNSPPKGARSLFFVGSASGAADEHMARDLAVQKALSELTVFCGAQIKSDFKSEEVERNGQLTQSVELTVDIAGDELTIREAVVKATESGPASDGGWDAYALVEWPKSQYEAVLASQRQRAERALAAFLEAEAASKAMRVAEASTRLKEAKKILGPMKAQVPLDSERFPNSGLLWDAVEALKVRLANQDKERRKVFHVAVECSEDGKPAPCAEHRVGAVKEEVSKDGFKVSSAAVSSDVARQILASANPAADAMVRSAGFVLAVHYDAKLTAKEDGFTFVHCGGRGVIYDTDADRIIQVSEVKPKKAGHVNFKGAQDKSCGEVEKALTGWLAKTLPTLQ
ncbi:MAG: hypothetical protein KC933_09480 [Myxococcales bacterium]|nr:hypothetical protein [Myxococcales bacterium]